MPAASALSEMFRPRLAQTSPNRRNTRVTYFPQRDKRRMIDGTRTGFIVDGIGNAEFTDH
jgi:hypothetical protein